MNTSERLFANRINSLHRELLAGMNAVETAFAAINFAGIERYCNAVEKTTEKLLFHLAASDHPAWLGELVTMTSSYKSALASARKEKGAQTTASDLSPANQSLFKELLALIPKVEAHSFSAAHSGSLLNVDEIVDEYIVNNRVNELYGEVVTALREIIDTGEVDSVRVTTDLHSILATLENAKDSPFYSKVFTWKFVARFFKNFGGEYLSESKAFAAFRKTCNELDLSIDSSLDNIAKKLDAVADEKSAELQRFLQTHRPKLLQRESESEKE